MQCLQHARSFTPYQWQDPIAGGAGEGPVWALKQQGSRMPISILLYSSLYCIPLSWCARPSKTPDSTMWWRCTAGRAPMHRPHGASCLSQATPCEARWQQTKVDLMQACVCVIGGEKNGKTNEKKTSTRPCKPGTLAWRAGWLCPDDASSSAIPCRLPWPTRPTCPALSHASRGPQSTCTPSQPLFASILSPHFPSTGVRHGPCIETPCMWRAQNKTPKPDNHPTATKCCPPAGNPEWGRPTTLGGGGSAAGLPHQRQQGNRHRQQRNDMWNHTFGEKITDLGCQGGPPAGGVQPQVGHGAGVPQVLQLALDVAGHLVGRQDARRAQAALVQAGQLRALPKSCEVDDLFLDSQIHRFTEL